MTPSAVLTQRGYIPTINPWRMFTGAVLPNWLMRRTEISPMAKICYARLAQYAGEDGRAFPKIASLAKELGISERQVRTVLKELRDGWLIHVVLRRENSQSSLYVFLEHPWQSDEVEETVEEHGEDDGDEGDPQEVFSLTLRQDPSGPSGGNLPIRRESEEENQEEENQEPSVLVGRARFASQASTRPPGEDFRSARGPEPKLATRKPGEARSESGRALGSRPASAPSRPAPSPAYPEPSPPVSGPPTGGHAPGNPTPASALTAIIEAAKKKAAAEAESKLRRTRVREEKAKNLEGSSTPVHARREVQRIERVYREEMAQTFPGLTIAAWDGQQRGQTRKLLEKYGSDLVADAVKYVVRNWHGISEHYFKGRGDIPTVGLVLKLHERLVPQAEQWSKHAGAIDSYRQWVKQHPDDPYPPEDLEKAYISAKQSLEKLGMAV